MLGGTSHRSPKKKPLEYNQQICCQNSNNHIKPRCFIVLKYGGIKKHPIDLFCLVLLVDPEGSPRIRGDFGFCSSDFKKPCMFIYTYIYIHLGFQLLVSKELGTMKSESCRDLVPVSTCKNSEPPLAKSKEFQILLLLL